MRSRSQRHLRPRVASTSRRRGIEAATANAARAEERPREQNANGARRIASHEEGADAASRAQARAETLARALEELSGASGRAIIGNLEGVLGSFLDLIEIDDGFERAVESAAGASVSAMVVDGRRSARAALAALRREGGAGLILPVGETEVVALAVPAGTRALRDAVRHVATRPST